MSALAIEHWPYDAGCVALAELADATLITLDRRISAAPGLRCAVATPGG